MEISNVVIVIILYFLSLLWLPSDGDFQFQPAHARRRRHRHRHARAGGPVVSRANPPSLSTYLELKDNAPPSSNRIVVGGGGGTGATGGNRSPNSGTAGQSANQFVGGGSGVAGGGNEGSRNPNSGIGPGATNGDPGLLQSVLDRHKKRITLMDLTGIHARATNSIDNDIKTRQMSVAPALIADLKELQRLENNLWQLYAAHAQTVDSYVSGKALTLTYRKYMDKESLFNRTRDETSLKLNNFVLRLEKEAGSGGDNPINTGTGGGGSNNRVNTGIGGGGNPGGSSNFDRPKTIKFSGDKLRNYAAAAEHAFKQAQQQAQKNLSPVPVDSSGDLRTNRENSSALAIDASDNLSDENGEAHPRPSNSHSNADTSPNLNPLVPQTVYELGSANENELSNVEMKGTNTDDTSGDQNNQYYGTYQDPTDNGNYRGGIPNGNDRAGNADIYQAQNADSPQEWLSTEKESQQDNEIGTAADNSSSMWIILIAVVLVRHINLIE